MTVEIESPRLSGQCARRVRHIPEVSVTVGARRISRREFVVRGVGAAALVGLAPLGAVACGSNQQEAGQTQGSGANTSIAFWHTHEGTSRDAVIEIINQFEGQNQDVAVSDRVQEGYSQIVQQIQAGGASGEVPAVATVGYELVPYAARELPHLSLSEASERFGGGLGWLTDGMQENILELGRVDGAQQGVPFGLSVPVLFYNAKMFSEAGLQEPPATWEQFREYSRRIVESAGVPGFGATETEGSFFTSESMIRSNGGEVLQGRGEEVQCVVDRPTSVEAMRFLTQMVLEDEVASNVETTQGIESFLSGQLGSILVSSAYLTRLQEGADFKVGAAPMPTFGDKPRRVASGGNVVMIFAQDENQQRAAYEFVQYLHSPPAMSEYVKGTGYVPLPTDLADRELKGYFEENPEAQAGLAQAQDVRPTAAFPENGIEALQILYDARQRALTGNQEPEAAMGEAAVKVNQLIST